MQIVIEFNKLPDNCINRVYIITKLNGYGFISFPMNYHLRFCLHLELLLHRYPGCNAPTLPLGISIKHCLRRIDRVRMFLRYIGAV